MKTESRGADPAPLRPIRNSFVIEVTGNYFMKTECRGAGPAPNQKFFCDRGYRKLFYENRM